MLRVTLLWSVFTTVLAVDVFNQVFYPGRTLLDSEHITVPQIHKLYSRRKGRTRFTGVYNSSGFTSYEAATKPVESDSNYAYETVSARSGKVIETYININEQTVAPKKGKRRVRRNVYGRDDRLYVPLDEKFGLTEPYSYTVRISTGCSGVAVSPRHVLTAAHCVHDQKDYIKTTKDMKVGFLDTQYKTDWYNVQSMRVSKGWIDGGTVEGPLYDYALLKLARKHDRPYITLTVSESDGLGERITFNGFDDDKPESTLWTRTCSVVEEDGNFLYNFCDAKPGSSGSGVYSWVYDEKSRDWQRQLVGVFSGNRWRMYDRYYVIARNFNVAVRLTSRKYAQICEWMGNAGKRLCRYTK